MADLGIRKFKRLLDVDCLCVNLTRPACLGGFFFHMFKTARLRRGASNKKPSCLTFCLVRNAIFPQVFPLGRLPGAPYIHGWSIASSAFNLYQGMIMQMLNQSEVSQVSGGAAKEKDPALGLFPQTGLKIIDDIHKMEWALYGKLLFGWLVK